MKSDNRRLFLALWPGEAERARLVELTEAFSGGRRTRLGNLHMTLVFLGATSNERLSCYTEALRGIQAPPLTLTLDRFGYWRKPRVLWLGTSRPPAVLSELVAESNRRFQGCGFTPERRPFLAHVTLARDYPGPVPIEPPPEPLSWRADHMAMVESVNRRDGVHYEVIDRFALV